MNEESTKSFQDSLFTALNLFNNHEWYEAHDAFEEIWNSLDGDERQVIQGILQVSVSQFHLRFKIHLYLSKRFQKRLIVLT